MRVHLQNAALLHMKKRTIRPLGDRVIVYPEYRPRSPIIQEPQKMLHQIFSGCWQWRVISVGPKADAGLLGKKVLIDPNKVEPMELEPPDHGLCLTRSEAILGEVKE